MVASALVAVATAFFGAAAFIFFAVDLVFDFTVAVGAMIFCLSVKVNEMVAAQGGYFESQPFAMYGFTSLKGLPVVFSSHSLASLVSRLASHFW